MEDVEVRAARPEEFEAVAELRWRWELEMGGPPTVPHGEFVEHFADWARTHTDSHRCTVAVLDGAVIGMAWLAVTERVPTPVALIRASGDLQSVYLVPEERANGVGGRLVTAALEEARELGLNKVTVQSGTRAVTVYARNGFAVSPKLLVAELAS